MTGDNSKPQTVSPTPFWQKALLVLGGFLFAILLVLLTLWLFPNLVPSTTTPREESAGVSLHIDYYSTDGDLFRYMPGAIRPPAENVFLQSFDVAWDKDGFRIPQDSAPHYPIVLFGDSFVEGNEVPVPWPDRLAEALGVPVRGYGYRGFSPQDIAEVAQEFIPEDQRTWVLYAHFSGNDIAQAQTTKPRSNDPLTRLGELVERADRWTQNRPNPPALITNPDDRYAFPMPVIIGGSFYELAFLDAYIWWQIAPEGGFEHSRAFQVIEETMQTFEHTLQPDTCKAMIFVPVKGQLYYPYIHPGTRQYMLALSKRPTYIDETDILELLPYHFDYTPEGEALFIAHLHDQRDAIARLAAARGWFFIDLLAAFETAVAEGELLYYHYDSHWNQDGHTFAAEAVAKFMLNHPECPLENR